MNTKTLIRLPSLDALAKRHKVDLIILFGSEAKRKVSPLSDIDIAVHIKTNLTKKELFDAKLTLAVELQDSFKRSKIDVVTLNDAPLRLQYEIFKYGRPIYCESQLAYIEACSRAVDKYLDFEPFLRVHYQEAKRYFKEASP